MAPHKTKKFSVRVHTEKSSQEARLRSHVAKKRTSRVYILRKTRCVTLFAAAALFVFDRGLRRHQERLLGKVDRDLRTLQILRSARQTEETHSPFVTAKEYFEMATGTDSL